MSEDRPCFTRTEVVPGTLSETAERLGLPSSERQGPRLVIGRRAWLSLPEIGITRISAKVDTGAYTSSLHAEHIQCEERDGKAWVRFVTKNFWSEETECEARVIFTRRVKSSSGEGKQRYFIKTLVRALGGLEWPIRVSLADRSEMTCPMLLGRRALSGRFVVDPQVANVLGQPGEG